MIVFKTTHINYIDISQDTARSLEIHIFKIILEVILALTWSIEQSVEYISPNT